MPGGAGRNAGGGEPEVADCPISVKFCVGKQFCSQNFRNATHIVGVP